MIYQVTEAKNLNYSLLADYNKNELVHLIAGIAFRVFSQILSNFLISKSLGLYVGYYASRFLPVKIPMNHILLPALTAISIAATILVPAGAPIFGFMNGLMTTILSQPKGYNPSPKNRPSVIFITS